MATFNFTNAYAVNTATTPASKEANSLDFVFTGLGPVAISDNVNSRYFSGNDVSAIGIVIGGGTYYGWISRPIKVQGKVVGFYFWTDADFTTLQLAQADGNMDGDSNVNDNSGFILVVDQSYFSNLGYKSGSGTSGIKNVGSSSDRVDTALNSLIPANSAPVAVNDSATFLEDGGAQTGNVLSNDTDANNDTLTVSGFSIGGVAGTLGTPYTITNVGSFTLAANGSYSFTPLANYAGPVPVVTYTIADGWGGTAAGQLAITLAGVNDAPAGTGKTITFNEDSSYTFAAADFGFTDPSDSPANSLYAVKITTLPDASKGSLYLGATAVTAGQTITLANLSQLKFTPVADGNGSGFASFTFQVQDNGGTANGGIDLDPSPKTITFDVNNVNDAPLASADTVTAVEDGANPSKTALTGLLANDTDRDTGDTLTVASAGSAVAATTTIGTNTAVIGLYGTLTLSSDGSYTYAVDNTKSAVQALRTASDTLSDSFSYTIKDGGGLTSASTLTVTIQGANDAPTATADYNVAKESIVGSGNYGVADTTGYKATGNVLNNDTDPDNNDTAVVMGLSGSATASSVSNTTTSSTLVFTPGTTFSPVGNGDEAWYQVANGDWRAIFAGDGTTQVTATGPYDSTARTIPLSAAPASYYDASAPGHRISIATLQNVVIGFKNSSSTTTETSSSMKSGTVSTSEVVGNATVALSGWSGEIAVGMTVSGTGIPDGTTVTEATYDGSGNVTSVKLSNAITSTNGTSLSFSAAIGSTITGHYGTLTLASNGSYTYTPTVNNPNLNEGNSGTETFTYTMKDASNVTSSSTLNITVLGSGTSDPHAVADTVSVTAGGAAGTGSVLSNDTTPSGTLSVSKAHADNTASETDVAVGGTPITGHYGILTIRSDGSYSYALASGNATVEALNSGETLTDTFFYRATNGSYSDIAPLTVTIHGANNVPTAVTDTATATEKGGTANNIAGSSPSGNVLTNDSDVDHNDTLTVKSAGKSGAPSETSLSGSTQIDGAYGRLTIDATGHYTYVINDDNASVQALNVGQTLTDTFTYTAEDSAHTTAGNTLTITINGADDAPVNALPASPTFAENASAAFTGLSIADVDSNSLTVTLTVSNGELSIGDRSGGATISADGATLTLSGTAAQINAALATLSYQGNAHFSGTDRLMMTSSDGTLSDVDTLDITVSPDNRAITPHDITVNEASPYAVFTFDGASDQQMSLALANGSATGGSDFAPYLEVFDGSNWIAYAGGLASIPNGKDKLFVRVPVLNDAIYEGDETFTLTATNKAGDKSAVATAHIVDDGSGNIYVGTLTAGAPTTNTNGLDDDRALTVSSITVNEASPYAIFSVGGAAGQALTLTLVNGTADNGDHGSTLEYYDGTSWVAYTSPATIPAGGVLLVRTTITNDNSYEGPETFGLLATNLSGRSYVGTAVITDDGTGLKYDGTVSGSGAGIAPVSNTSALDNDLAVNVTAYGPVNENSHYAMFTIAATAGETLTLSLGNTADASDTDATLTGFTLEFSTDGATWKAYSPETQPLVPVSGKVYVRVDISSESDSAYEGAETFTLKADITTGAGKSDTATATIVDDGTGLKYDGSLAAGNPATSSAGLDNDNSGLPGLMVGNIGSHTTEAGGTASFTIRLATQPTSAVTITLGSDDTSEGTVGPTTLTFTGANWNQDQTVTITGVDDPLIDGNVSYHVSMSAASGDANYNGKSDSITVVNDDNDNAALVLGAISAHTTESGGTATFTVRLSSQPTADVTVALVSSDATEGSVGPTTLTFTSGNWNTPQTVTVTGADDPLVDGNIAYQINLSATSADGAYQGKTGSVAVVNDDNDSVAPPPPVPPSTSFEANLDPAADNGASNQDRVTSVIEPDFIIKAGALLSTGNTAILLDPQGQLVGAAIVTADDVLNGTVKVPTIQLDDGTYVFTAEIRDANGVLKGKAPVTVTIVTDLDGIVPSIELGANGGDFNHDSIADWQQNNIAQLPLASVADFLAGKNAPASSFGAILAGDVASGDPAAAVQLDDGAQLTDISLSMPAAPLPAGYTAATPLFDFAVTAQAGMTLTDLDPTRNGLQTRIVIDLPQGVAANTYLKRDAASQSWHEFLDDGELATYDDGATLLDLNHDGLIDRIVVTLTDGAAGDDDGTVNGMIVDPGMLALKSATPVYSILLADGDRFYTTSAEEAAAKARGAGNLFEGARFDSLDGPGGEHIYANYNPFTTDWYFAADGQPMPYNCYQRIPSAAGFQAAAAGSGVGEAFHLYMNGAGITQLVTKAEAATLGLAAKGYADRGAVFSTTTSSAFTFDAEAYLVANQGNADIQAFVQTLASHYRNTSDAGFIEAVEQNYLAQVEVVGLAHGTSATAADLNAAFGTAFGA